MKNDQQAVEPMDKGFHDLKGMLPTAFSPVPVHGGDGFRFLLARLVLFLC